MKKPSLADTVAALREYALTFPEAHEDFPWGHRVIKVKKKIFLFLGTPEDFGMGVKLPFSAPLALQSSFITPTAYGLGKAGWVSAQMTAKNLLPLEMLKAWIAESYRAVAPATLVARMPGGKAVRKKPAAKKAATKPALKKRVPSVRGT